MYSRNLLTVPLQGVLSFPIKVQSTCGIFGCVDLLLDLSVKHCCCTTIGRLVCQKNTLMISNGRNLS